MRETDIEEVEINMIYYIRESEKSRQQLISPDICRSEIEQY